MGKKKLNLLGQTKPRLMILSSTLLIRLETPAQLEISCYLTSYLLFIHLQVFPYSLPCSIYTGKDYGTPVNTYFFLLILFHLFSIYPFIYLSIFIILTLYNSSIIIINTLHLYHSNNYPFIVTKPYSFAWSYFSHWTLYLSFLTWNLGHGCQLAEAVVKLRSLAIINTDQW